MTEPSALVLFKDDSGGYYLLPAEALEAARVPADQVASIESMLAGDTSGFAMDPGAANPAAWWHHNGPPNADVAFVPGFGGGVSNPGLIAIGLLVPGSRK